MVHVPLLTGVTDAPTMVQTLVVSEAKVGVNSDDAVAITVPVVPPYVRIGKVPKVMLCAAGLITNEPAESPVAAA